MTKLNMQTTFPILHSGVETYADIVGVYVQDEIIYIPVIIAANNELKVYQVLPNGLKQASKRMATEFAEFLSKQGVKDKENQDDIK